MTLDEETLRVGGDIEPGTYLCTLIELEKFYITASGEYEAPAGEQVPRLHWVFATEDGATVEGTTSLATGPRSKMRQWMSGIGVDLSHPADIKLRELVGREALVNVSINENGYAAISSVVAPPSKRGK